MLGWLDRGHVDVSNKLKKANARMQHREAEMREKEGRGRELDVVSVDGCDCLRAQTNRTTRDHTVASKKTLLTACFR